MIWSEIDELEQIYLKENDEAAKRFEEEEKMYQEIVDSFTEFSQLVEEKDYDEDSINQICTIEVHDDILDTIEMINEEMKRYN